MKTKYAIGLTLMVLFSAIYQAQFGPPTGEPDVVNKRWHAQWISMPNASNDGYGVYLFRKTIGLTSKPNNF
jgi:alpha-L-rhamnosidase